MTLRRLATLLVALGLTVGLIGTGISAQYTDSATAVQDINVGTFGIEISSTVPGAQISLDKHSVTFTAADIVSSAAGGIDFPFTVTSTGSIPVTVHLTQTTPVAPFSSALPDPVADVALSQNGTHEYLGGLRWPELVNTDLGKTATITYTASAREGLPQAAVLVPTVTPQSSCGVNDGGITIPVAANVHYFIGGLAATSGFHQLNPGTYVVTAAAEPGFELVGYPAGGWSLTVVGAVCNISFVGAMSANGTSVTLPAGWQPGDTAIVMATRTTDNTVPSIPTGWTQASAVAGSFGTLASQLGSRVLQAGDTSTGVWTGATRVLVMVYRNVSGLGSRMPYQQNTNVTFLQILGIVPQVTNGTSWVASFGACDPSGSGNCKSATFTGTVTRTSGATSPYMLGADTNGGVSSWAPHASSGIGSGPTNSFSIELKRTP